MKGMLENMPFIVCRAVGRAPTDGLLRRRGNIARWAALLQTGSYGGAGNIARWAALLRSRLIEQGVAANAMTLHHVLEIL